MLDLGIRTSIKQIDGSEIIIETGKLAKQADGSVVVKKGNTMLLATVVSKTDAVIGQDFLPLSVDYQERYAASGRFPGGFIKRESRLSEHEILISRLVDRALRPMFPEDYHAETQVLIFLISADTDEMPDSLACLAASAAIAVSDIPFNGPISEVRVARINGEFVINPKISEMVNSDLDLIIAGSEQNIVMVEGEMKEVSEEDMLKAIKIAHEAIKIQCKAQEELASKVEASKIKRTYCHEVHDLELKEKIFSELYKATYDVAKSGIANKKIRKESFDAIKQNFLESIPEEDREAKKGFVNTYFHDLEKKAVRDCILEENIRLDGRKLDQIRPIWSEIDYLPASHGSAIFTRGETQSLTTCTLGSKLDEQTIDGVVIDGSNKFLLHYNFLPFSTGEAKFMRGAGRREIGHGNLALRALKPVMPEDNPYTIRLVSDILESNGSSSMATVCAGTLALMDAGVKIKKPVSGIAMGLITNDDNSKFAILSDILGDEDHLGDMDFKVTGTKDGITACQMDIKVKGLTFEILLKALNQAKEGRLHILNEITKTISEPRSDYKPHAPRIVQIIIPKEFIGAVIGPGGKIIQEMQRQTNTTIVIEEKGNVGVIDIVSNCQEDSDNAQKRIKDIVAVPEIGTVYEGTVKNIMDFGAFIEILPGKDGLLHISEIDWKRIEKVTDVLKTGDKVSVKLIEIDSKTGKLKLSRRALIERPTEQK
ncbi:MAG: polyribonucleotide nucleotidyltransferase [Bacteroidetes bacterium GWF2_29_10]|nr:MAG: polyribonucleotide nucleotidyltransferase [Bacteroidetes bacterium GWF2_29_10]